MPEPSPSSDAMPIRTLIVDDEPLAREGLRLRLAAEPDVTVLGECGTGHEAVAAIRREAPDLLLLDVQMPGLDGFDVLARIGPERMPLVIFVTAYDEHALRAFEVHALDYLLKPIDENRLAEALERARRQFQQQHLDHLNHRLRALLETMQPPLPNKPPLDRLIVKSHGRVVFLPIEEVDWIEAAGDYVKLHAGEKAHLLRETMTHLAEQLPAHFQRIHRSTIVNLHRVRELRSRDHGEYAVHLHDGTRLKLSRSYRDALQDALGASL